MDDEVEAGDYDSACECEDWVEEEVVLIEC